MANEDSTPATSSKSVNPPEWGAPEWETMNESDFADNLLAKIKDEKAILTCDEMDIIEKFWNENRRARRCTLIALTKPYSWLEEQIKNDTEFAQAMVDVHLCSDSSKYKQIADLLFDAERRGMCALTFREDMQELIDKAKAVQEQRNNSV